MSCPMYINCYRDGCHVLCMLTVTGRGVISNEHSILTFDFNVFQET